MTLPLNPPNTIHLGGDVQEIGDITAGAPITPGMLIEMYVVSGGTRWRPSTLTGAQSNTFAKNQSMLNKGVDDVYATGDLVQAAIASPGCTIWGIIASGANLLKGAPMSDNGDGKFKAASGVTNARCMETLTATAPGTGVAGLTSAVRIRVEFL
jgi:hypothetical protein